MWCGILEDFIVACPQRLKIVDKHVAKLLAPSRQGPPPPRLATIGKAYIMSSRKLPPLVW